VGGVTAVLEDVVAADVGVVEGGAHLEEVEVADDHGAALDEALGVLDGLVVDDDLFLG